jgi:hypothetical protein
MVRCNAEGNTLDGAGQEDAHAILRKIRQVQTASHFNELMISPGLQAPTLSKE